MTTLHDGPDSNQAIVQAFDKTLEVFNVRNIAGQLVPEVFDEVQLSYIVSGNGTGELGTIVYKLSSIIIATVQLSYDSNSRIIDIKRI